MASVELRVTEPAFVTFLQKDARRLSVTSDKLALVDHAHVIGVTAVRHRRSVEIFRIDIALPQVRGLEDVQIGFKKFEAVSRHSQWSSEAM